MCLIVPIVFSLLILARLVTQIVSHLLLVFMRRMRWYLLIWILPLRIISILPRFLCTVRFWRVWRLTGMAVPVRSRWIAFTRVHDMDAYSRHEVVDRCWVALDHFVTYVVGHDVVEAMSDDDEVKVAVVAAEEALSRAYQAAGAAFLD